jgi:hypothetical protein
MTYTENWRYTTDFYGDVSERPEWKKIPGTLKTITGIEIAEVEPGSPYGLHWSASGPESKKANMYGKVLMPCKILWFDAEGLKISEEFSDAYAPDRARWAIFVYPTRGEMLNLIRQDELEQVRG